MHNVVQIFGKEILKMAVSKEEREMLSSRITERVKLLLEWKQLSIDEVTTEYGWDLKRMKRLMEGQIRYKLEDAVMLSNTFAVPIDILTSDFGENDAEKFKMMFMLSQLSEEHQRAIVEVMKADDVETASKELIAKLEAEK